MSQIHNIERVRQFLQQGPAKAATLLEALNISQPTFSRLWSSVPNGVVLGASKARQYALRRQVPGVDAPIPVFRVAANGRIDPIGHLDVLQGGFYALTPLAGTRYALHQGMPFFISDLRPQGFLGRMEPGRHRDLDLPADILTWTDEQVLKYISRRSDDTAGDLILGNDSYGRHLALLAAQEAAVLTTQERALRYPQMADDAMQGDAPGSSAGGEQPKFTAAVRRTDETQQVEHVIVKFSPKVASAAGRRWGDLLVCEHLALQTLLRNDIAAATSAILEFDDRVFLEVVRVDRAGPAGRRPMATFSALDGDLGMMDRNWTAVAQELGRLGMLPQQDVLTVELLDLFGALIGNTDKHHGNIAVAWTFERQHRLLDAYDMLPMLYRPNAHGEVVERTWIPDYLGKVELRHLARCHDMALQFWRAVLADPRISDDFKRVTNNHLRAIQPLTTAAADSVR